MKYKGDGFNMWDAWYMNVKGTVHGFHLKDMIGKWDVGHVVTNDLLHFERCADILPPLDKEEYPDDCLGKYTGCAVYDETTDTSYVYYTMRNSNASEKIGLAISHDLVSFPLYEKNPVIEIDEKIFVKQSKPSGATDCRDLVVIRDEENGRYLGYFAAMADINGSLKGVVAVAESTDLLQWENQRIAFIPPFSGVVEVPDVFTVDGKWYMTMLTGRRYGAHGIVSDTNVCGFTLYAVSERPEGPFFMDCENNIFLCGTYESGYSCRSVEFEGKRYVLYIDKSEYGTAISLPKEIKCIGGRLCPCYTDILKKLRTGNMFALPDAKDFDVIPTSFAWNTVSGHLDNCETGLMAVTEEYGCQRFLSKGFSVKSLEMEADISSHCRECGFVLACYDENGKQKDVYTVSLNFYCGELIVYRDSHPSLSFTVHVKRRYNVGNTHKHHLRVIASEGQFEIYVDDVLALQGNMFTEKMIKPGVFCTSGSAIFENTVFCELEN